MIVAAIAALANIVGWGFFILWFEPHPINGFNRQAWPDTVRPGDIVTVSGQASRYKGGCSSVVTRQWRTDDGAVLETTVSQVFGPMDAGREPPFQSRLKVPGSALPGTLILHTSVEFRCNAVQRWLGGDVLTLNDIAFTVLP